MQSNYKKPNKSQTLIKWKTQSLRYPSQISRRILYLKSKTSNIIIKKQQPKT